MKVNVPKQGDMKRYKHSLLHDVSTTSDVGFLQPFMVREFPGNSHIKISCGQIVRFANMVKPTFGSISLNTYNVFVPIESIYHPYSSLRTQQTYMGANSTYIPQSVIKVSPFILNCFLRLMSDIEVWTAPAGTLGDFGSDINFAAGAFTNVTDVTQGATYLGQFVSDLDGMAQDMQYQSNPISRINSELNRVIGSGPMVFKVSTSQELGDAMGYDWIWCVKGSGSTPDKVYGGVYHRAALNIRKVLYGCGWKLYDSEEALSFLPVMAYYKAWFDLFAPQRNTTWKDEAFAGFQEYCEQYGQFVIDSFLDVTTLGQPGTLFVQMMLDLAKCYITANPDFVSAHITGQRIGTTPNITLNYQPGGRTISEGFVSTINSQVPTLSNSATNTGANNAGILNNLLTPMGLELLQKVQKRTNVHTALGGRVRELLKSITGDDYLDEDSSYWIGAQKVDVLINPVFNTAESSEAALGQFAGAAFGSSEKSLKELSYECKELGFWVCFGTIVPDSKFAQGFDMMLKHVGQYDFYDPMVDSSTMVPTARKYIFAERQISWRTDYGGDGTDLDRSFGNVPAQIEYCVTQNVQNGDMSRMSTRASYLPWTLDKLLPYDHTYKLQSGNYVFRRFNTRLLENGTIWRYIGMSRWIGMYDRIWEQDGVPGIDSSSADTEYYENILFYNGPAVNDNVSVQCTIFADYWHSKLPVRDSYHTGVMDDGMTVEIA